MPPSAAGTRSLDQLENDASTRSLADGVLAALSSVSASSDDEKARVNFIRFKAYAAKEDDKQACIAIKEAIKLAVDPAAKSRYSARGEACP
jgi:hypothetical protein